eukprot:Opistho-2@81023
MVDGKRMLLGHNRGLLLIRIACAFCSQLPMSIFDKLALSNAENDPPTSAPPTFNSCVPGVSETLNFPKMSLCAMTQNSVLGPAGSSHPAWLRWRSLGRHIVESTVFLKKLAIPSDATKGKWTDASIGFAPTTMLPRVIAGNEMSCSAVLSVNWSMPAVRDGAVTDTNAGLFKNRNPWMAVFKTGNETLFTFVFDVKQTSPTCCNAGHLTVCSTVLPSKRRDSAFCRFAKFKMGIPNTDRKTMYEARSRPDRSMLPLDMGETKFRLRYCENDTLTIENHWTSLRFGKPISKTPIKFASANPRNRRSATHLSVTGLPPAAVSTTRRGPSISIIPTDRRLGNIMSP